MQSKTLRAARQHISQATAFKVAGIPKEKHTFTIKQGKGSSGKTIMETKSKHKEQCHSSVKNKRGKVRSCK